MKLKFFTFSRGSVIINKNKTMALSKLGNYTVRFVLVLSSTDREKCDNFTHQLDVRSHLSSHN